MKINGKLKQRLERLEQTIRVERVPLAFQLLRLALPQISDQDLEMQMLIFRRGAPILAHTEEEAATLERLSVELEAAAKSMAAQALTPVRTEHKTAEFLEGATEIH